MRYIDIKRYERKRHVGTLETVRARRFSLTGPERGLAGGHIKPPALHPPALAKFFDILEEIKEKREYTTTDRPFFRG